MVERQQIHHRPEFEFFGALRNGGEKHAGRGRIAERRVVMLGQVIAIEAGAVIGLDEFEPVFEMLLQRTAAVVEMIEYPETHLCLLVAGASWRKAARRANRARDGLPPLTRLDHRPPPGARRGFSTRPPPIAARLSYGGDDPRQRVQRNADASDATAGASRSRQCRLAAQSRCRAKIGKRLPCYPRH